MSIQLVGRGDSRVSRHADRAGQQQPLPGSQRGRKPRPVSPHEAPASLPTVSTCCAQNRHGVAEHELRDPALYRIRHVRASTSPATTGVSTRCTILRTVLSDAYEGITHSLCYAGIRRSSAACTTGFSINYNHEHRPRQIEFSRLESCLCHHQQAQTECPGRGGHCQLAGTIRRMPTIAGMRRRGYPAAALREFVKRGGVTKKDKLIEMGVLWKTVCAKRLGIMHHVAWRC